MGYVNGYWNCKINLMLINIKLRYADGYVLTKQLLERRMGCALRKLNYAML